MKKSIATVLITTFLITSAALCRADEKKDHVCFRVLDSNKDGLVTYQEFTKIYGDDREAFNKADEDKDSQLTHDEYHTMLGHGS